MKTANRLLLLGTFSALSAAATGADTKADTAGVDTSKWQCKLCKFEDGVSATVDVGAGGVSRKSNKFGDYTGLNENGAFFVGDGSARAMRSDGTYWNIDATNLGLDSRAIAAEGGRQGQYRLFVNYSELPHYWSEGVLTPFLGVGSDSLTLPPGFVRAPSTAAMPAAALQDADIETKRKQFGVGGEWTPAGAWEYAVNVRHETREGTKRTAGAFFVNAAQLVAPVDYVTDQVDASASYTSGRLQAKFAYYGSKFNNDNAALTWRDPFTAVNGESAGQLAQPPDNEFHQLSASLGYKISDRTRASGDIAWGRMTQDAAFLAATLNTGTFGTPVLPRSSLDGRADTLNGNVRFVSAVTDQVTLNAAYLHDERDNQTSQALYPYVVTDTFLGQSRVNLPYTFRQDRVKLSGDFKATTTTSLAAGYDYDRRKRTYQEVDKTEEDTVWGKVSTRPLENLGASLKLGRGKRDGSNYQTVPQIQPPENPLLRKFNMANRDRDNAQVRIDLAASDTVSLGFGFDFSKDNYDDSQIGLTNARDRGFSADFSWMINDDATFHLFANRQLIDSAQKGSATFSTPDWSADNKDTIDTVGIGVKYAVIKEKLDVGADYTYARSHSETNVNTGIVGPGFPQFRTTLNSFKLYANYRLNQRLSLLTTYWYENYDSENWMIDGVTPSTITNVLAYGEQTPRYNVHLIRAALRYKF